MELEKEKEEHFLNRLFCPRGSFLTFAFYINVFYTILYWKHFQNIHTFTYQKTLLDTLFCLFFKPVRKFLYKSLLNSAWLWSRPLLAINKKQKYLFPILAIFISFRNTTRPPTCWKPDSCFWFVRKAKKRVKANL